MKANLQIKGLDELIKKMKESNKSANQQLPSMIKTLSKVGYDEARERLDGGLDMAKLSIRYKIRKSEAEIYTVMKEERAKSIEEGHKPGQPVFFLRIARWLLDRRNLTQRRLPSLTPSERAQITIVKSKIEASGSKGKKYMAGAEEKIKKEMPKQLRRMADVIEITLKG